MKMNELDCILTWLNLKSNHRSLCLVKFHLYEGQKQSEPNDIFRCMSLRGENVMKEREGA